MGFFEEHIASLKAKGLFRSLKVLDDSVLNFCSNDYLGLAQDPRLKAAARDAVERFGAGSGAARLISGNFEEAEALERRWKEWKGAGSALLFNSGYHANIGAVPALAQEGSVIFSDELNHASLIDGCRLSKAKTVVYRHNDLNHLEELLRKDAKGNSLIVTESVFSMEGDVCPVDDLIALAKKYDAWVYLDEAHAVGVFGEKGEGLAPANPHENLICMGTLGKALGSYGAVISGPVWLRDYLINTARSFIFATALPPAVVAASLAALRIVREERHLRDRLWQNIRIVERALGLKTASAIFSLPIGPADKTMDVSQKLWDRGVYVQGIRPPTVPEGTSRLRLTLSAAHTEEQISKLIEALKAELPKQGS